VLITATISGALGMGGGIVLMGVLGSLLPAPAAIALHGLIQLSTNGFRALLLRRSVDVRFVCWYGIGSLASLGIFTLYVIVVDNKTLFIMLGVSALLASFLQGRKRTQSLDLSAWQQRVSRGPWMALMCGALITAGQLTAGAAGAILDIFFLGSSLDRHSVVATKAITQVLGHSAKVLYFLVLVPTSSGAGEVALWGYALLLVCAFVGTRAGTMLLDKLNEERFRALTRGVVFLLGVVYLMRGVLA
jgi:uncharacterized membrane protein YfcA